MATGSISRRVPYDQFVIQSHLLYTEQTIDSKDSISGNVTISKAGYYPLAIVGWSASGAYSGFITPGRLYLQNETVGSGTVTYNFQNNADFQLTSQGFSARVLWVKA